MLVSPDHCLFELWQAESAPIYHMSAFWPVFDEAHVMQFVRGGVGDDPSPVRPLSVGTAAAARQKISDFLTLIDPLSPEQYPCKSAYIAFERERLAAFDMILRADDPEAISRLNDELFGDPAEMNTAEALSHLAGHIDQLEVIPEARVYRDLVLDAFRDVSRSDGLDAQFAALNDYRLKLRPLVLHRFGYVKELLNAYPSDAISSTEVRDVLQATLENSLGESRGNWTAAVSSGAPNVFINYQHHEVTIPAHRQYTKSHVDTLAVHEIGVHIQRSVNGANSLERLAGYGLAGYGPAEEAFGVLLGNATKENYHQINSLIPFAVIAYAQRADRPNFRQVHAFAKALIICLANPSAETLRKKDIDYGRAAFSRTIRVLRLGHSGLIERSTTKYWRGQLLLARHFDQRGLTQTTFDEFFVGKYDCLEPSQLDLITRHAAV